MQHQAVITLCILLPAVKQAVEVRGTGFPAIAHPGDLHLGCFFMHSVQTRLRSTGLPTTGAGLVPLLETS